MIRDTLEVMRNEIAGDLIRQPESPLVMLLNERYYSFHKTSWILFSRPVPALGHYNLSSLLIELIRLVHRDLSEQTHLTVQCSGRHLGFAIPIQHGLIVFSVLRESAVQVEAGSHCTGLTKAGAIVLNISGADTCGVEAKAIVEVLDVNLLLALSEHLWQVELLLKSKVPHSRRIFEA